MGGMLSNFLRNARMGIGAAGAAALGLSAKVSAFFMKHFFLFVLKVLTGAISGVGSKKKDSAETKQKIVHYLLSSSITPRKLKDYLISRKLDQNSINLDTKDLTNICNEKWWDVKSFITFATSIGAMVGIDILYTYLTTDGSNGELEGKAANIIALRAHGNLTSSEIAELESHWRALDEQFTAAGLQPVPLAAVVHELYGGKADHLLSSEELNQIKQQQVKDSEYSWYNPASYPVFRNSQQEKAGDIVEFLQSSKSVDSSMTDSTNPKQFIAEGRMPVENGDGMKVAEFRRIKTLMKSFSVMTGVPLASVPSTVLTLKALLELEASDLNFVAENID